MPTPFPKHAGFGNKKPPAKAGGHFGRKDPIQTNPTGRPQEPAGKSAASAQVFRLGAPFCRKPSRLTNALRRLIAPLRRLGPAGMLPFHSG